MIPVIKIETEHLDRMVEQGIAALAAHTNIYQRSGELVTVVREPDRVDTTDRDKRTRRKSEIVSGQAGTPQIRSVSYEALRVHLGAVADWRKYVSPKREGDEGEWAPAHPDAAAITAILDPTTAGGWPGIRPIRGILESPSLAPSGRIIATSGYDIETGYVLLPSVEVGNIDEKSTQEQARAAMKFLWTQLFCDFPYPGLGHCEPTYEHACGCPDAFVGIAAILSVLARPAIEGSIPGFVFETVLKGGSGSKGKTLQIEAISTLATGRRTGWMTFPTYDGRVDESELEKVLALMGSRIIAFDSIKGSAFDSSINTRRSAITIFSGEDLAMSGDFAHRVLCSRLEGKRDEAVFRHPSLLDWIRDHRAELIRACLVILRAFVVADARNDWGRWGSFEAWNALIPGAILYAGGPNVLRCRKA